MITIRKIRKNEDLSQAFEVRRKVFMDEQMVSEEDEFDQYEDESVHYLACWENTPCGAARWRRTPEGIKLERFAVLPAYRGNGIAYALIERVLADIEAESLTGNERLYLNAQVDVVGLYEKFGFIPVGEEFLECDIRHQQMERLK